MANKNTQTYAAPSSLRDGSNSQGIYRINFYLKKKIENIYVKYSVVQGINHAYLNYKS